MAGLKRLTITAAAFGSLLFLSTCENALLGTLRVIVEESSDPLVVSIQPATGTYTVPQSVQLSANKTGAVIRYTTNGSDPTADSGTVYAAAVPVSASTTIKARAFLAPYSDSVVAVSAISIPFSAQLKMFSQDPQADDQFGWASAIDGDYAIVGSPNEDGASGNNRGAAYIFHRTGPDTWDSGARLAEQIPTDEHCFGNAVDIDGDYAIVGNGFWEGRGSAYIFHRTGTNTWDSGCKIDPPSPVLFGNFGYSVAISGDYAVVGAFGEPSGATHTITNGGVAYVFHRTGTNTWGERTELDNPTGVIDTFFGRAVAIDGDHLLIGAPEYDSHGMVTTNDVGYVCFYRRTDVNTWSQSESFVSSVIETGVNFGCAVDISGDYAVVGAQNEDDGSTTYAGAAYIFHRIATDDWEQSCRITATDPQPNDYFGSAVAISGDTAVVSSEAEDTAAVDAGAVYCFHSTATNIWDEGPTAKWMAFDAVAQERFGQSVGLSGTYMIVGPVNCTGPAPGNASNAGAVYILH
jgi:hypothetical protein